MRTKIMIRTSFPGIHNWPEASQFAGKDVQFLEHPHRHTFHVKASLSVTHDDRQVEFFVFKKAVDDIITNLYEFDGVAFQLGRMSCEQICKDIRNEVIIKFNLIRGVDKVSVEVWEDNEVGAYVGN